jgi:ribonuclease G
LPRWIYEAGFGENRAILIEHEAVVEAAIELPDELRVGSIVDARLHGTFPHNGRTFVSLSHGSSIAYLEPVPPQLTGGQAVRVEVLREPIWDGGLRLKRAKVRVTEADLREGPTLWERLHQSGYAVKAASLIEADALESWGWSEILEEAERGEIAFEGGMLRMALTPAMTLFDVDGFLPPPALAIAGARAAGQAIRRFGITGSIGIDLPTLPSRADRQAAAKALDEVLPQPFERTAMNGFGFLQIVRRRERASIPELLQGDPIGAAARALLRRAERTGGSGERTITAAPAVLGVIREDWRLELERRIGAPVALRHDKSLAISAGHVQAANP